jgi:DnaK suppressor protein
MATQATNITAQEMKRRKAALESKLREFLDVVSEREELLIENLADPIDRLKSSTDRELAIERLDQRTRLVREIQSALVRIEEGSYGFCESCDSTIAPRRLDVLPWARFCVDCQSRVEADERTGRVTFADAA